MLVPCFSLLELFVPTFGNTWIESAYRSRQQQLQASMVELVRVWREKRRTARTQPILYKTYRIPNRPKSIRDIKKVVEQGNKGSKHEREPTTEPKKTGTRKQKYTKLRTKQGRGGEEER